MRTACLALGAICLVGCPQSLSGQRLATEELRWPLPPNPTRIEYVGELRSAEDIGRKQGFLSRVRSRLAGADQDEATQMARPHDVYNLGDGRIFVSDATKAKVLLFHQGEQEVRVIGETGPGQLGKPMGLDGDDVGTVYVADALGSRVVSFDADGNFLRAFGGSDVLHNPVDVAVDAARDALWVVDSYQHQTLKFSLTTGELLLRIGIREGDLAAKREDLRNLRAGMHGGGSTAAPLPEDAGPEVPIPGHDGETVSVPRDLTENRGSGPGEFRYPGFVAVAPDGTVYVTDQLNFRVQAFSSEGTFLRQVGRHGRVAGGFARPKGLAVDTRGHLYVADALFNNIQIFDDQGRLLLFFSEPGQGEGEIFMPLGVSVDASDRIWVADRANERVQIFQYLHVEGVEDGQTAGH